MVDYSFHPGLDIPVGKLTIVSRVRCIDWQLPGA